MCLAYRNAEIEAQIAHLRAELLHKEQENDRVQLQLTQEKEERERAQRKVRYMHALDCHWQQLCLLIAEAVTSHVVLNANCDYPASPLYWHRQHLLA